ncbi:hypothetical protein ACHAXA_010289 [Cyclostephanos tholiformis]|uniref:Uncharacterized protein n=1 Tax=Cyclostephanos tholiformis TaxID=382380 RepID=A0ABD3RDQ8_9STRA
MYHPANHSFYAIPTFTMARSFLPILLLALAGAAAGFFEAVAPHQEVTVPNKSFAANPEARGRFFDTGLDNPDVVSDMKITPSRKCGFCMGDGYQVPKNIPMDGGRRFRANAVSM